MLRLPSWTVRLRLTLLYSGLFIISGTALLATTYLIFRANGGVDLIVPNGPHANPDAVRQVQQMFAGRSTPHPWSPPGAFQSGIAWRS